MARTPPQNKVNARSWKLLRENTERKWEETVLVLIEEGVLNDTPEDRAKAAADFDAIRQIVIQEKKVESGEIPKPRGRPRKSAAPAKRVRNRNRSASAAKPKAEQSATVTPNQTPAAGGSRSGSPLERGLGVALRETASGAEKPTGMSFPEFCQKIVVLKKFNTEIESGYAKQHATGALVDSHAQNMKFVELLKVMGSVENMVAGSAALHELERISAASAAAGTAPASPSQSQSSTPAAKVNGGDKAEPSAFRLTGEADAEAKSGQPVGAGA